MLEARKKLHAEGKARFSPWSEAKERIRKNPGRYVDHIYGLAEVGGTSVLLLSDVSFDSLGYRTDLQHEPLPQLTWNVLHKLPKVVGVGGVLMSGIWWITKRRAEVQRAEQEEKARGLDK